MSYSISFVTKFTIASRDATMKSVFPIIITFYFNAIGKNFNILFFDWFCCYSHFYFLSQNRVRTILMTTTLHVTLAVKEWHQNIQNSEPLFDQYTLKNRLFLVSIVVLLSYSFEKILLFWFHHIWHLQINHQVHTFFVI